MKKGGIDTRAKFIMSLLRFQTAEMLAVFTLNLLKNKLRRVFNKFMIFYITLFGNAKRSNAANVCYHYREVIAKESRTPMLLTFKFGHDVVECASTDQPDWLDLADPDEEELNAIQRQFDLPPWFLRDPLDSGERPRVDMENGSLLIVVRLSIYLPLSSPVENLPMAHEWKDAFRTMPAGIILTGGRVITICRAPELVREHLKPVFGRRHDLNGVRLSFALCRSSGTGFIKSLARMEELADAAEMRLRRSPRNEEILALMDLEKALIDITTALKSNFSLLDKFRQPDPFGLVLSNKERDILDDALTECQQAVFMADIFGQVLSSLSNAFGSIISNNLNKTMKFLAGVTIVLTIPTMIGGLYGMNMALPGSEAEGAFWVLAAVCLGLMLTVSILFAKKKWF